MSNDNDNNDKTSLAVVESFEKNLELAVNGESKKIPKWQVDSIMKMKDKHIGSLQSQIRFLQSNKKHEFAKLYEEDIENLMSLSSENKIKIKEELKDIFDNFKLKLLEALKKQFALDESIEDFTIKHKDNDYVLVELLEAELLNNPESLSLDEVSFLQHLYLSDFVKVERRYSEYKLNNIVNLHFRLHYEDFFTNAKNQIKKLERLFEESLSFNDLVTTHGIYQELKKADSILDNVSKVKIKKVDIDFDKFIKDWSKYEKLEKSINDKKVYEFSEE